MPEPDADAAARRGVFSTLIAELRRRRDHGATAARLLPRTRDLLLPPFAGPDLLCRAVSEREDSWPTSSTA